MSRDRSFLVSTSIARKLSRLSHSLNEQCIFKVHKRLRSQNEQAYEPKMFPIGPYHHGKYNLKSMEIHKLMYLQELLVRRGEENADRYIIALMDLEDRARRCYAEEISLSEDDFVEMLCLDGLFIIEFLRKICMPELQNKDDKIFRTHWLINTIMIDFIFFENQIPFFVLEVLFEMTRFPGTEENLINFASRIYYNLSYFGPSGGYTSISANEVIHLLDLVHKSLCSSFAATLDAIDDPMNEINYPPKVDLIKSANELLQVGIKFESAVQHESWLHITFENGIIRIPTLTIDDLTESILRNLIAYELYTSNLESRSYVTDYVRFLDFLIDSPRDVEQLRCHGIIVNLLGDDEAVSTMFNKLLRDITVNDWMFCYWRVFKEVNEYAIKRRNMWKGQCAIWVDQLMKNYFSSPWSIIKVLAAVVLLSLTVVQTIFSIPAENKGK